MEPNTNPYIHPTIVQPAAPVAPAAPTLPAPVVTPDTKTSSADDQPLSLDDLFPKETTTTPAAETPAAPVAPAAATQTDEEKAAAQAKAEFDARFTQTGQKIDQVQQALDQKISRQAELNGFFTKPENQPFLKYQGEISKVATDPRYVGMKLERVLAFTLGANQMMKIGGEMAVAAYKKAAGNNTQSTQNSQRVMGQTGASPDYSKMTDAEFANATMNVIQGNRPQ